MEFNFSDLKVIQEYCTVNHFAILAAVFGTTAATVYIYGRKRKFNYWKRQGLEGPKPSFLLGNSVDDGLSVPERLMLWQKQFGEIYGLYSGSAAVLNIGDADWVEEALINNFDKFSDRNVMSGHKYAANDLINQNGDQWRLDRSIISPTFSSGKMKQMYPLMREAYTYLDRELDSLVGQEVEVKNVFSKLTTMVIARCAFASQVDAFSDPNNELLKNLQQIFVIDRKRVVASMLLPKFVKQMISFSLLDPNSLNFIGSVCERILNIRRNSQQNQSYADLLQLLIDANKKSDKHQQFSDVKIIANSILFFNAGYETTSTLLTWASYCLALNQDVQERLYDEIKSVKESQGEIDYETLFELKYLDAVINETLRMFPPAPVFLRVATQEHVFGDRVRVRKGDMVRFPVYAIHHNEKYYKNHDVFDPDRFMPHNKGSIKSGAFIPFVIGPRNCIGKRFAQMEAKIALAESVYKYKYVLGERTPVKPEFKVISFILAMDDLKIKFERRN